MPPDNFADNLLRTLASYIGLAMIVAGLIKVLQRRLKKWMLRRRRARRQGKPIAAPDEAGTLHPDASPVPRR